MINRYNILRDKSFEFALKIVEIYKDLSVNKKEYVLSNQMLRSGTSIGAMTRESEYAQSRADFISKLSIALKEANETDYWIELLSKSGFLDNETFVKMSERCIELIKLLTSSINTAKGKAF